MSNSLKTVAIVIICVVALALAVWSGYRSFVPQGKVTYGGSFGSRDAERGADATEGSLSGAPPGVSEKSGPGGGSLSGAPAGLSERGR